MDEGAQRTSLHDALAALASPHHQGRHEQGDHHGHRDEGAQDVVGRVVGQPARQGAVLEVVTVDADEELVHLLVRPEAAHLCGYLESAVCQGSVQPVENKNTKILLETW